LSTCQLLIAAKRHLTPTPSGDTGSAGPIVYSDAGVENVNERVEATLVAEGLRLVLAQVEVTFSNSMIEAFWRSLKHNWLYLHSLDSLDHLRKLVAFFVDEHNRNMPHSAFRGQTPDEMYSGTGTSVDTDLDTGRRNAIERRLASNRAASCHRCETDAGPPDSRTIPALTHLRTVAFGMS
jgi:putative transposase